MSEPKLEGQNPKQEEEKVEKLELDEKKIKQIEGVLSVPREVWVEKQKSGGMQIFNNYRAYLPGGRHLETFIVDNDIRTINQQYMDNYGKIDTSYCRRKNLTCKEFAKIIIDALVKTGTDLENLRKNNERVLEIERKISEVSSGKLLPELPTEKQKEVETLSRELSRTMAELHYDAAPAALKLFKEGYQYGDLF